MKYYKLSELKLQKTYGKSSHYSNMKQNLTIVQSGSNRGEKGTANFDLILPFPGIPITRGGEFYDIRNGFMFTELLRDYFSEMEDGSTIIPIAKIKNSPDRVDKKQLYVTFDPTKVEYVLIKRKCNQNTDQLTRNDLRELASLARPGAPKDGSEIFWDYYVLFFKTDYNHVFGRNDRLLSDAKFAALSSDQVRRRRQLLKKGLEALFGNLERFVCLESIASQKARAEKPEAEAEPEELSATDQVCGWHFEDELYHSETWVLDEDGRCLSPDSSSKHDLDRKNKYTDVKISVDDSWEEVSDTALVVQYIRKSFSEPAIYAFLQRPAEVTAAQLDRLAVIEAKLRYEVQQKIAQYMLYDSLAMRGREESWTLQLHDEETLARAATR